MATIVSALSCWMSDLYFTIIGTIEARHVLFAALLTSVDLYMSSLEKHHHTASNSLQSGINHLHLSC